jgi:protein-S-isoprenylcysteine O-methyltransferase Ste14
MDAATSRLQGDLWSTVAGAAAATPTILLVAGGMNDVINAQGYTQAAWWNRIPLAAWVLILTVAVACNAMLGRVESRVSVSTLLVLPLILSISLFLIADIDSPRSGVIRVTPQNLIAMVRGLPPRPPAPASN